MKNFLKRLAAMLAVIAVLISVTALLVAPQLVIDLAGRVQAAPSGTRAILVVVAVLVDLLLIAVLVCIVRPPRKEGLVVRARGAKAEVSVDSVQRQINTRIAQVSDVLDVQTGVEVTQEGAARVEMNVRTRPDIVIPEKQKELGRVLRQLIEKQMGLRLAGDPIIHIALATDEFDTTDRVTTVVEPIAAPSQPSYASLPATASYTEVAADHAGLVEQPAPAEAAASQPPAPPPPPAPAEQPAPAEAAQEAGEEQPAIPEAGDEPWRAFLLEDSDKS